MSYKQILNEMISCQTFGQTRQVGYLMNIFIETYSGNYKFQEFYNLKSEKFDIKLVFENPAEELMFTLKYR